MKPLQHKRLFSTVTTNKKDLTKPAALKHHAQVPFTARTSPEITEANDSLDDDKAGPPSDSDKISSLFSRVSIAPVPLINTDCEFRSCISSVSGIRPSSSEPGSAFQQHALFQARCRSSIQDEQSVAKKKSNITRRYTLRNYRELQLDIKLGGLGPDIGTEQELARHRKDELKKLANQWTKKNKEELEKSKLRQEARAKSAQMNSSSKCSKHSDETTSSYSGKEVLKTQVSAESETQPVIKGRRAVGQSRKLTMSPVSRPGAQDPKRKNAQDVKKALQKTRDTEELARCQLDTLHEALRLGQLLCLGSSGVVPESTSQTGEP